MSTTTRLMLLGIYFIGFLSAFYLGMRYAQFRARKNRVIELGRAYNQGWKSGRNFLNKIQDQRLDMDSAIRILTGEEADQNRPI